ncbi:MAG: hypothetical protein KDK90_28020 [Leptospiraceae bacterium]|nr:hypothetical protein [Leptospiraceae bacterium]
MSYIDFIIETTKNPALGKESFEKIRTLSASELSIWFKEKGYEVSEADCQKLIANKDSFESAKQRENMVESY